MYKRQHINEVLFCQQFLEKHPMKCVRGRLFTVDGLIEDEGQIGNLILEEISGVLTSGLSKVVTNLLASIKLQAYSPPLPIETDRIHVANGTYFMDGSFTADKSYCNNRLTVAYNPDAPTPKKWLQFLSELLQQEDIPTFGHRIHKEAQRMITLVSDILQLSELDGMSKQQENSPTADFVPVDLGVLVKDVATNMTVNARKAYITLQYKVQPVTVRGSHDLLTELVTNLCDNAIRYNRPGGHVELSCGTNADGCPYFCVEDNGIGIPQDSQSRVFERFYRVDKSRSKATGGTGLGLAIVKHIAVLHGARIDLESTVGTGTTIRIIFPKM